MGTNANRAAELASWFLSEEPGTAAAAVVRTGRVHVMLFESARDLHQRVRRALLAVEAHQRADLGGLHNEARVFRDAFSDRVGATLPFRKDWWVRYSWWMFLARAMYCPRMALRRRALGELLPSSLGEACAALAYVRGEPVEGVLARAALALPLALASDAIVPSSKWKDAP